MYNFEGKKVLVTGGTGFFASHLVKKLIKLGADVHVTVKYNSLIDNIRLVGFWDKVKIIECDLRNTDSLKQIKELTPEYVFHFAAYNHVGDSFLHVNESLQTNLVGSANLLEAYKDYEKFIYIATSEVYGYQTSVPFEESMLPFPTSPYAVGKYAGEIFAQMEYHVRKSPIVMLRPFNVFGPYQSPRAIIAELILKCIKGEPIKTTEGKQTRDFNFVTNLVEGVLLASQCEKAVGQITNIGSGEEITIRDLVEKIHKLTKSESELQIGALEYRPTEIWRMQASSSKAKDFFDWSPEVSFEEGLIRTIDWFRKYHELFHNDGSPLMELSRPQ